MSKKTIEKILKTRELISNHFPEFERLEHPLENHFEDLDSKTGYMRLSYNSHILTLRGDFYSEKELLSFSKEYKNIWDKEISFERK